MLSIIVAYDKNRVIGYQNKMPWYLPNDLARLKQITLGKTIVMGLNTFNSIGHALSNRNNIVLTSNLEWNHCDVIVMHSLGEVLMNYKAANGEWFIFGGGQVYQAFLPYVQKIYATEIDAEFLGDCFFPAITVADWNCIGRDKYVADENNKVAYEYVTYVRKVD